MEIPDFSEDIAKIKRRHNERVLSGGDGRTAPLVEYGIDDFSVLESEYVKSKILNAYTEWKYWLERRRGIQNSFIFLVHLLMVL